MSNRYILTVDHIDTCLSCYVNDHCNGDTEFLIGVSVDASSRVHHVRTALTYDAIVDGYKFPDDMSEEVIRDAIAELFNGAHPLKTFTPGLEPRGTTDDNSEMCEAWFRFSWEVIPSEDDAPEMVPQPVQQAQCNAGAIASDVSPAATLIRSAQSIRDGLDPALVARYRHWRLALRDGGQPMRAHPAMVYARADTKDRYPYHATGWQTGRGTESRFIESPSECGLRFVGFADEIARSIRHEGHFTDRDIQDSVMRGVVYQMPSRKGELLFVAGYADPNIDGAVVLDFSHIHRNGVISDDRYAYTDLKDFALDAAYAADGYAERAAETECDYQESWRAGIDYVNAGTEYREARAKFIKISQHARDAHIDGLPDYRRDVCVEFLSKRDELMSKRAKLFEAHGNTDTFREHLPE